MNSATPYFPAPRTYKDVPLIPPIDPDDLKRVWNVKPRLDRTLSQRRLQPWRRRVCRRESAPYDRQVAHLQTARSGTRDDELDDVVFRVAATSPLHEMQDVSSKIPATSSFLSIPPPSSSAGWRRPAALTPEPVATKVAEGGRCYVLHSLAAYGAKGDSDREARHKTRPLVHHIWRRFSGFGHLLPRADSEHTSQLPAVLFADFLIANTDIVQQVVDGFRQGPGGVGVDLLLEIEQRAMKRI